MKLTLAIRYRLKQREHMKELVSELKRNLEQSQRLIERHEQTIKILDFELHEWDKFSQNKT